MNPSACGSEIDAAILELTTATMWAGALLGAYFLFALWINSSLGPAIIRALRMRFRRNRRRVARSGR